MCQLAAGRHACQPPPPFHPPLPHPGPGRGDARVIPRMWYSIELQATSPVPEWGGQLVRSAQEEDAIVGADGRSRWAYQRQTAFHLVR